MLAISEPIERQVANEGGTAIVIISNAFRIMKSTLKPAAIKD